jgi:hypothetical protein
MVLKSLNIEVKMVGIKKGAGAMVYSSPRIFGIFSPP